MTLQVSEILEDIVYTVEPDSDGHSRYSDEEEQNEAGVEAISKAAQALLDHLKAQPELQYLAEPKYLVDDPTPQSNVVKNKERAIFIAILERELGGKP